MYWLPAQKRPPARPVGIAKAPNGTGQPHCEASNDPNSCPMANPAGALVVKILIAVAWLSASNVRPMRFILPVQMIGNVNPPSARATSNNSYDSIRAAYQLSNPEISNTPAATMMARRLSSRSSAIPAGTLAITPVPNIILTIQLAAGEEIANCSETIGKKLAGTIM